MCRMRRPPNSTRNCHTLAVAKSPSHLLRRGLRAKPIAPYYIASCPCADQGSSEMPDYDLEPVKTREAQSRGCGCFAAVVPEDELVEVDLELRFAHSVVSADQPLLEIAVPCNNCFRRNDDQRRPPVCPDAGKPHPQQPVGLASRRRFFTERSRTPDLMPECNFLQLQSSTGFQDRRGSREEDCQPARHRSSSLRITYNFHDLVSRSLQEGQCPTVESIHRPTL